MPPTADGCCNKKNNCENTNGLKVGNLFSVLKLFTVYTIKVCKVFISIGYYIIAEREKESGKIINREVTSLYTKNNSVMACITPQANCERIIEAAKELAERMGTKVTVVTVQPKQAAPLKRSKDMKLLCSLAQRTGIEISVRYSDNPPKSVAAAARELNAVHIFTGTPAGETDFIGKLSAYVGDLPVSAVGGGVYCTVSLSAEIG